MGTVLAFFLAIPGKVKLYAAGAVGLIVAGTVTYFRIRKDGENSILAEQAAKRDANQAAFNKIDSGTPNFDDAVSKLRDRSNGK